MKEFKDAIVQTTTKVIWSLSHAMSFVSLCVVVFLFSCCQEKTEESSLLLGENEICFKEKLVSISKDGDDYYIGTESSGHVFVYSAKEDDVIDTLKTDYGRIYQVRKTHKDNIFFVGTQNMGLKKTHQHGDSLITDITYKIRGKDNRYSCYDIFFDNDTVYAMTSHGIYSVEESDTLKRIFPHPDQNVVPKALVANNMVKASGYLYAATDTGLVVIKNRKKDTIAVQKKIKNVADHDNFIYALGDSLYKIDPASRNVVDTVKLKAPARYYFYADSIHHFLTESYMILAHDSVLHKPEQHKQVNTRRKLSLEGHNVIADGKEYSLLVAENALWQVGHHYPSVFGNLKKEGGVKLACTDGKSAYFLVGKKVYKLGANNVANEVLELKDEIKLMECKQDSGIYYVNSDTCVYFQRFNQEEPEFIGKSDKEITAMCIHNSVSEGVILGIRDGLIYMEKKKVPEPITLEMNNGNKDTIPYIRRFAATESNYYCPTMNEGIFYGSGKDLHSYEKSRSIQFIRDVVCPDSKLYEDLYWLTNKYLYLSSNDSVPNENYGSRLLASRHGSRIVYVLGEIGGVRAIQPDSIISDRNKKGAILFSDIVFRPESSFMLNDTLYLGGQSGVIAFSNEDVKEMFKENKSLKYHYVEFKDKEERQSFVIYLSFLAVLIIVIICYVRYRVHKVKIKEIKRKRDKLNSILEGNAGAAEEFNDKFKGINEETNKCLLFLIFVKEKKLNDISNDLDSLDKQVQDYLNNESINKKVGERVRGQIERLKQRSNGIESQLNNDGGAADKFQTELESICTSIAEIQEKSPETVSDDELNEISNDLVNLNNRVHEYQNIKIKEIKQHALNESETFKRKTKELYISLNRLDDAKKYISNEQLRNEIEELKEQLSNYEVGLDDELKNHIQSTTGSVTWYLIERISDQINKIEKVDERSNLIEDSKSAIEQKDIEILLDVIRHNEEKLKEASQKNNKSKLNIEKNNPSSNKPRQTMTFKLKSGMAMHHVDYLYQILVTEEKWIEGSQGDFRDLFSNESNEIWLTWKGIYGKGTLVEMFKEFVGAGLITVAKGFTIPAILEGHFKDDNSKWLTGLDKGNKVNEKAKPIIEKCVNVLKQRLKIDRDNYDDDEDFQSKYDSYDHQDLNLHKR